MSLRPPIDRDLVIEGDNSAVLPAIASDSIPLIYIDPPFNTGTTQKRHAVTTTRSADGDRTGFGGHRYETTEVGRQSYSDSFDDYRSFIEPRLLEAHRILTTSGTLYFHIDYREAHYCKVLLDSIFGRDAFINEIIWAYDYGGRSKKRWPAKHDTILMYVKDPSNYYFDQDAVDRIPYMAPGLVGAEKAARGPGRGRAAVAPLRELGEHPESGGPVNVMEGRYGPYVKWDKINAMIEMLQPYGVKELVQSGVVAIGRGPRSITDRSRH